MKREGTVIYVSQMDALLAMDPGMAMNVLRQIRSYVAEDVEIELNNDLENAIWRLIKPQIDANIRRADNGNKGGRPKAKAKPVVKSKEKVEYADVEAIPLDDGSEFKLSKSEYDELKRLYPRKDLETEFRKMRGWCNGSPSRRKTRRGVKRFINAWLAKEPKTNTNVTKIPVPDFMMGDYSETEEAPSNETLSNVLKMQEEMRLRNEQS